MLPVDIKKAAGVPFDDLYDHVVARVGNAPTVDQAIDELAGAWNEFVNGCREHYS